MRSGQPEAALQRGLDRGDADLAVALDAMAVAAGKQRARHEHRQIEFCAGASSLLSRLPPIARGISEVMRPQAGGGATPITPKNGFSGRSSPHGSRPTMRSRSSGMLSSAGLVEIVGQGAGERADQIVAPVLPQLDVENLDLQHVAGLGALDRDGPGQDMTGQHPLVLGVDLGKLGRDVKLAVGPAPRPARR